VVEFDAKRTTRVTDRDGEVEAFMLNAKFVKITQRLPREIPDLRVVSLGLKFCNDNYGQNDSVLSKPENRSWIREKNRRIKYVRSFRLPPLRVS
jgi:hypothetical protein